MRKLQIWKLALLFIFASILTTPQLISAETAFSELPLITVRLANPSYDFATEEYCLDVEFQSDTPDQEIFGMNVRFFYDDHVLEFIDFRDFEENYASFSPNPPIVNTGLPNSGNLLFGFGGPAEFVNGAIIRLEKAATSSSLISTTGWTRLFSMCFSVEEPTQELNNFHPAIVWDLEKDPANGGFLTGGEGVLITLVNPASSEYSMPANENVVQFNWTYNEEPGAPYGYPITASSILSSYIILAENEVHLHGNIKVFEGGVGVLGEGEKASIHDHSLVNGANTFVKADELDISSNSTVLNPVQEQADVNLPPFYDNPTDPENDVKIEENDEATLTQTIYGKITVKNNAMVTFTSKDIYLKEMVVEDGATVIFEGCTNVMIAKKLQVHKNTNINPTAQSVVFYAMDDVEIKEGTSFHANVYTLKKLVVEGKEDNPTVMTGLFIAGDKVESKDYVEWHMNTNFASCEPPVAPLVDCCNTGDKPAQMAFVYTSDDCTATQSSQGGDKIDCTEYGLLPESVYIVANDDSDPTSGHIWFSGAVMQGDTYVLSAFNDDESHLSSTTFIHIYDETGTELLQSVEFHTSCSQPLFVGDQFGANLLVGISFENGESCGDVGSFIAPLLGMSANSGNEGTSMENWRRALQDPSLELVVSPNPFINELQVVIDAPASATQLKMILFSGIGEVLLRKEFDVTETKKIQYRVDAHHLLGSVYILQVQTEKTNTTTLLVNGKK